ncbi:hypothetical protein LPTSP4_26690 [Leptospira ryugenii]|uniref:Uncharacterized protein n=1 Tax=Leptospira ryugenii TaxID=1917863 RepID=A0A2P2E2N2_9LEPT|nr:hypothetical protein [Leptospira ryugenii]GBF51137.1 hypothetical protein LPTSP4_26690 [Leptospira ryugenii]
MLKKMFFHIIGFGLILAGWFVCVINVGLDRGATPFRFFSVPNVIGLLIILVGAYFPELATKFLGKDDSK